MTARWKSKAGRSIFSLALVALALVVAGCAAPEEAVDDDGDDVAALVSIDGRNYECDDAFDLDGICDEYEMTDDAGDSTPGETVTSQADGTVMIGGRAYECDDTIQVDVATGEETPRAQCEEYELVE